MPFTADLYYYLHEEENGTRPAVVLIHGAGGTHLHWPPEVRRMPGYRVFALDLPGHGKSGGRGQQSVSGYAGSVLVWLEATGLHRAVFVGHSMGGAIALSLGLHAPEQILGLGLLGCGASLSVEDEILQDTASETTFHRAVETIVSKAFSHTASPRLAELAAQRMGEIRPSVLHGDFLACNSFEMTERVAEIRKPTLVVSGADDQMVPQLQSQLLAGMIPGARLETIPGAGHMAMLEKPLEISTILQDFLAEIS